MDPATLTGQEGVMSWEDRIELNPEILVGKPVIRGTRISVELVIELLAGGWSEQEILENYDITHDDILACLRYASEMVHDFRHYKLGA